MFKILCVLMITSYSTCEPPSHLKPLVFPTWPSKANLVNKQQNALVRNVPGTLVIQIRSDTAMPSLVLKQRTPYHNHNHYNHHNHHNHLQPLTRNIRPLKMAIAPHFVIKSAPLISKLARKSKPKPKPTTKTKLSSVMGLSSVKPPEDYVYEKPFTSSTDIHKPPVENTIRLTHTHFGPIHTIPAPNLGIYTAPTYDAQDNNINHQNPHTYHVTEDPTNDQTIQDPFSGHHKLFAPDPDPSLPAAKINPSLDPFSMPSNGKPLPLDVQHNYLSSPSNNGPIQQPLIQFSNPIIDQYQPQVQPFYSLQSAAASNKIPLAVYNPTYLVTQSNNLYNQHQQQLFKPNPSYLNSLNSNLAISDPIHEVASTGQILEAARDPSNQIHPQYQGNQDNPTFSALIATQPDNHITENTNEYLNSQGGFIVSNYFDNTKNQQYYDLTHKQRENDKTLAQAHLDLHNQLIVHNAQQYAYDDQAQIQTQTESTNTHEEHQKLLQQQLESSPLRIFVPDDEYQTDSNHIFKKRSDDYSEESSTEPKDEYAEDYDIIEDSQEYEKSSRK